jgi:hypothetical protein
MHTDRLEMKLLIREKVPRAVWASESRSCARGRQSEAFKREQAADSPMVRLTSPSLSSYFLTSIPFLPPWPSQSHDSATEPARCISFPRRLGTASQSCVAVIPMSSDSLSFSERVHRAPGRGRPSGTHLPARYSLESALPWPCEPVSFHFQSNFSPSKYRPTLRGVGDSSSQAQL